MNKLIHNLTKMLDIDTDDIFYHTLNKIRKIKPKKSVEGFFIRVDYLLDEDEVMKQVEINTISCAFVFWGPVLNRIHGTVHEGTLVSDSDTQFLDFLEKIKNYCEGEICILIDNDTSMNSGNYNEKALIIDLCQKRGIKMGHHSFNDIRTFGFFTYKNEPVTDEEMKRRIDEQDPFDEPLQMIFNKMKVFGLYYRWFYNHNHYTEKDFILRAKLECCSAFSLPSVEVQMAGLKIFQMKLTEKTYLMNLISIPEIGEIYEHFGEFKSITKLEPGDEENFILKSTLEGGGNNVYGEDIVKYEGDNSNVFLMKKIISPVYSNAFLDEVERKIIPEIGIMGWLISIDGEIIYNENAGYICRSKDEKSKECGVSCGFGALDSIIFPN